MESCGVSRCHTAYSFVQTAFCLQMIIAISLWSGSKTLVSAILSILDPHQNSSQLSCSPVSWKSCSFGSAELALHALQQFIDEMDIGSGPTQSPGSGSEKKLDQPTHSPEPEPPGPAFLLCPGKRGSQALMSSYCWLAHLHPATKILYCPGKRGESSSPTPR